ncbi:MAG: M20/M25/M40 family metallo-hydrolase [Leptospira sp.]|nr:M20/M25/M40 family metallo-hydrolase [Leptospira sp.]
MYERLFLLIFISLFSFFYQCKTEPGSDFSKIQLASDSEVNWKNVETETVKWLSDYIKIDTVNNPDLALKTGIPTGNEIDGAKFLKQILDKEGISSEIIEFLPRRAVLYSRLKGNGTKKPVMLLHHMDVVPIEKSRWTKPPLSGLIENGKIYGRGALDDKGMGVRLLLSGFVT